MEAHGAAVLITTEIPLVLRNFIYEIMLTLNIHTLMTTLSTCWAMTINNPDENDYVLVRNPNEQHIRELVWTPEDAGTPHIQAFVKLMRQQRLSFVKKLFPRGHFTPITNDVYMLNSRNYAQKDDETTRGPHTITMNPVVPDAIGFLTQLIGEYVEQAPEDQDLDDAAAISVFLNEQERYHITCKPYLCKLVLSPIYTKAKRLYWKEILANRLNADDNEREGEGETDDDQTESIASAQESEQEESCSEAHEGSDSGSEPDSETEGGDEAEY